MYVRYRTLNRGYWLLPLLLPPLHLLGWLVASLRLANLLLHPLLLVLLSVGIPARVRRVYVAVLRGARCVFAAYRERYLEAYQQRYQQAYRHYYTAGYGDPTSRVYIYRGGSAQAVTVTVARIGRPGQQPA